MLSPKELLYYGIDMEHDNDTNKFSNCKIGFHNITPFSCSRSKKISWKRLNERAMVSRNGMYVFIGGQ